MQSKLEVVKRYLFNVFISTTSTVQNMRFPWRTFGLVKTRLARNEVTTSVPFYPVISDSIYFLAWQYVIKDRVNCILSKCISGRK